MFLGYNLKTKKTAKKIWHGNCYFGMRSKILKTIKILNGGCNVRANNQNRRYRILKITGGPCQPGIERFKKEDKRNYS